MGIGKLQIGYRSADRRLWTKYLLPHAYIKDRSDIKSSYYKYYYRWFNIFWCKPRKCEECGKYMTSRGGQHILNWDRNKILLTVCYDCYEKNKIKYREMVYSEARYKTV